MLSSDIQSQIKSCEAETTYLLNLIEKTASSPSVSDFKIHVAHMTTLPSTHHLRVSVLNSSTPHIE